VPEDLERPTIPFWVKLVICALAVVGLISIVKVAIAAVFGIIWIVVILAVILAAAYALRGAARRGPRREEDA
jgi:hypothetical protein